jgi:hypothetical protein
MDSCVRNKETHTHPNKADSIEGDIQIAFGRISLVLEDSGAEPLVRLLDAPKELSGFSRLAHRYHRRAWQASPGWPCP